MVVDRVENTSLGKGVEFHGVHGMHTGPLGEIGYAFMWARDLAMAWFAAGASVGCKIHGAGK